MSRIFSFFLVFFITFSLNSFAAESDPYVIENVPVNVTSKSPSASRIIATATAHRDAFFVLLARLNLATNVADNVSDEEISDMVRSEHIDNEKLVGNNYSAVFNITFAKDFVDHILSQKNSKKEEVKKVSEPQQQSYLVIPVKLMQKKALIWEENNDWKKSVETFLSQNPNLKFISPQADVDNIATLSIEDLAKVHYASLDPMISRYKASAAYLLFFSLDELNKKITVDISYIRKMQKKQMKLSFVNIEGLSKETTMIRVAEKTLNYIAKLQVSESTGLSFMPIRLQIPITTMGNYLMIKNKIENSNLVNALNIESISRDYAFVNVGYVNSDVEIAEAFAKIGLVLTKKGDDFYLINSN